MLVIILVLWCSVIYFIGGFLLSLGSETVNCVLVILMPTVEAQTVISNDFVLACQFIVNRVRVVVVGEAVEEGRVVVEVVLTHDDVVGVEAEVVRLRLAPLVLHVEGHDATNGLLGRLKVRVATGERISSILLFHHIIVTGDLELVFSFLAAREKLGGEGILLIGLDLRAGCQLLARMLGSRRFQSLIRTIS